MGNNIDRVCYNTGAFNDLALSPEAWQSFQIPKPFSEKKSAQAIINYEPAKSQPSRVRAAVEGGQFNALKTYRLLSG